MAKSKKKSPKGKKPAKGGINGMQIAMIVVAVVIVIGGATAGIVLAQRGGSSDDGSSQVKLPDWVYASTAPKGAAQAYQFALDDPEDLSQIPCYCGCADDGHKSNHDCFIKSRDGNNVTFDKHGAG